MDKYPFPVPDVSSVKPRPMDEIVCPNRAEIIRAKKCTRCGKDVKGFATEIDQKEYLISGWCHECQEYMFNIPEM